VHVAAPTAVASDLREAKIYVLTSGYTGSAAEHLTLALKRTRRATIIGETTAGMGHFGRVVELPAGFFAFIPIGRPLDPATGIGWEGIGIKPHLEVPARNALETALLRLGFTSEQAQALDKKWTPSGGMERVIPLRGTLP
jgi:C-terminal processing protease CtpA/Prc